MLISSFRLQKKTTFLNVVLLHKCCQNTYFLVFGVSPFTFASLRFLMLHSHVQWLAVTNWPQIIHSQWVLSNWRWPEWRQSSVTGCGRVQWCWTLCRYGVSTSGSEDSTWSSTNYFSLWYEFYTSIPPKCFILAAVSFFNTSCTTHW